MELLPLLLVPFLLAALVIQGVIEVMVWVGNKISSYHNNRRKRIEVELDRKQAELRATVLNLASQLGVEAHEARKALIRESFLASREENLPPR